jgi:hypothetical protein
MNIHLQAILGFTRGTSFWPIPISSLAKLCMTRPFYTSPTRRNAPPQSTGLIAAGRLAKEVRDPAGEDRSQRHAQRPTGLLCAFKGVLI